MVYHQPPDQPQAENGVIDLTDWAFTDNQAITLDGEWAFYPEQLIPPNTDSINETKEYIAVPDDWSNQQKNESTYGYGTYRLR